MGVSIPQLEGLRFRDIYKNDIRIFVTVQTCNDRLKFVVSDVTVRKYRSRTHISIGDTVKESYLYRNQKTEIARREFLADEYLKYVTLEQMEKAIRNVWKASCPAEIRETMEEMPCTVTA